MATISSLMPRVIKYIVTRTQRLPASIARSYSTHSTNILLQKHQLHDDHVSPSSIKIDIEINKNHQTPKVVMQHAAQADPTTNKSGFAAMDDVAQLVAEKHKSEALQQQPQQNEKVKKKKKGTKSTYVFDKTIKYDIDEALEHVRKAVCTDMDESIDIEFKLALRKEDNLIRGVVDLPAGSKSVCRVAVFANEDKQAEAREAGADFVGASDLLAQWEPKPKKHMKKLDRVLATPDMMPLLGKYAKILGPRNLMPTARIGTVTNDIATAVKKAKHGQVFFKSDRDGIVRAGIGRISFSNHSIKQNIGAVWAAVRAAKPPAIKKKYLTAVLLSSYQGPAVLVKEDSIRRLGLHFQNRNEDEAD